MDLHNNINSIFPDYQRDLAHLISIPSILSEDSQTLFGQDIQNALEAILTIAKSMGFNTYMDPKGYYGYAEVGEGTELFGILGHLDVVPQGDIKAWHTDPFKLTEKDGVLFGRGTSDDKGPLLAAMYALKVLLDIGHTLNQRVRFIFGTDEESLWRCMKMYVEKEELPSKGFTPDSAFPLIYAEKGLIEFTLSTHQPSDIRFKGGSALNAVPSQATTDYDIDVEDMLEALGYSYTVTNNEITVQGVAMHAKHADEGKNAIVFLAQALYKTGKTNNLIRFIVEKLSDPNGQLIYGPIEDKISGKLMLNVGKISCDHHHQEIGIDIRFPVTYPVETIKKTLNNHASQYDIDVKVYDYLKSIHIPKDSPFIQSLMKAYQNVTGDMTSQPISSGGATYARAMDNIVAFGALLPNSPKTEHQPNECIGVEDIKTAMLIYSQAFLNIVVKS